MAKKRWRKKRLEKISDADKSREAKAEGILIPRWAISIGQGRQKVFKSTGRQVKMATFPIYWPDLRFIHGPWKIILPLTSTQEEEKKISSPPKLKRLEVLTEAL